VKTAGWTAQDRPPEDDDIKFHRQLIIEIVFGLYHAKKKKLEAMGFPPQGISLLEIWYEFQSRRATAAATKLDNHHSAWPWKWHEKRWLDRRVNEASSTAYGESKLFSIKAGYYAPIYAKGDFEK